ncbi:unnamed protein product [Moneuplotes crassus]|uniref:Uncharacterized protein n=1 Tax=Euplotes crassus TaxID=5936 RepID=A0AAD1UEI0_EUPCR|nr:unnamed protein product [Moneuplotes crassus]
MAEFPKCQSSESCGTITHVVKNSKDSSLASDICVCAICAGTLYSGEETHMIPEVEPIKECLRCAEYQLDKINLFRVKHKLEQAWGKLTPKLKSFREDYLNLKNRVQRIVDKQAWDKLYDIDKNSKNLLNQIFDSDLMKQYNRQLQCRQFRQQIDETSDEDDKLFRRTTLTNVKFAERRRKIGDKDECPLKLKLVQANLLAEQRRKIIEDLEKDKENFEKDFQNFQQHKTETETKHSQMQQEIKQLNDTLNSTAEEKNKLISQIEEIKAEYANLQDQFESSKNVLTHSEYERIYQSVLGQVVHVTEISDLNLNLSNVKDQALLKYLQCFELPKFNQVYLDFLYSFNKPVVVNRFMKNALTQNIKRFIFDFKRSSKQSTQYYMETLKKVLPRIPNLICLYYLELSKAQFEDLLVACKNCQCVRIRYCYIDTETEVDFGTRLDGSSFRQLDFFCTGGLDYSKWGESDAFRFKNLTKGFSKVEDIRERKWTLCLGDCGLTKETVDQVLTTEGFTKVELEGL